MPGGGVAPPGHHPASGGRCGQHRIRAARPDHPQGGVMPSLGNLGGRLYRGEVSVDFVGRRKIFYMVSGLILLISIVAVLVRGLDYSVDFKGGSIFQFSAPTATATQLESIVTKIDPAADPSATKAHSQGKALWSVQTSQVSFAEGSKIQNALAGQLN